jgi:hypothetical protein
MLADAQPGRQLLSVCRLVSNGFMDRQYYLYFSLTAGKQTVRR